MGGTIGTITASQRSCTVRAIVPIFVQYSNESIGSMSGCVNQHRFSTLIDTTSAASSGSLARMENHSRNVRNSIPPSPPFDAFRKATLAHGRPKISEVRRCPHSLKCVGCPEPFEGLALTDAYLHFWACELFFQNRRNTA